MEKKWEKMQTKIRESTNREGIQLARGEDE